MKEFLSRSEEETAEIGRQIARDLPGDAVIHLSGDLGAGKTLLVRAMATALGADPREVTSPSFAIIHEYPRRGASTIIHIDGYRLSEKPHEWFEIGIPEILRGDGIKFIEWPKKEFERFEEDHVDIEVVVNDDDSRTIRVR